MLDLVKMKWTPFETMDHRVFSAFERRTRPGRPIRIQGRYALDQIEGIDWDSPEKAYLFDPVAHSLEETSPHKTGVYLESSRVRVFIDDDKRLMRENLDTGEETCIYDVLNPEEAE